MRNTRRLELNVVAVMASLLAWQAPALAADQGANGDKPGAARVVASANINTQNEPSAPRYYVASDEPRRLSDLAGNDERAWASARNVHPRLAQRRAAPR
jgi:hypothetical protein